jgi:hypothetical protein
VARVNSTRYTILGYVVWHGGKWYLRRRLPSARKLQLTGLATVVTLTGAVVLAKRAGG